MRGIRHWLDDLRHNGGMPTQVDRSAVHRRRGPGRSRPGAVVFRDEVIELIQYTPTTPHVHDRPLLIVPPEIGRYYFLDLAPGRSLVEYASARGCRSSSISWRNPTPEQADWNLDTYAVRSCEAVDAAREITGQRDVNVLGLCAGGITLTTLLNHLAATGDDRVHSAALRA